MTPWSARLLTAELVTAIRNLLPFTCREADYLPICNIQAELSGDKLTLAASNRYVLSFTEITCAEAEHDGSGKTLMPRGAAEFLARIRPAASEVVIIR